MAKRILDEFEAWTAKNREFSSADFASSLPDELVSFFASLLLLDTEKLVLEGRIDKEIENTKRALERVVIKEKISDLADRIKEFEKEGRSQDVKNLEAALAKAGRELASIEQGL
ncbi:MAG: hypothetical protein HYS83_01440 [Candidatus Blackburnbacteria bacterium]|nr:hypothetical protein [Candidatus Blackburnbacteria bacterium]